MKDLLETYRKTKYLYDKHYDIHICTVEEIDDLLEFIDTYWQKGHILTKSRSLLDWQHLDKNNNRYNFIIARSKQDGSIHGVLGFILTSIYDRNIEQPIRWGAIWKVREDVAIKGLGLALKGRLEELVPVHYIGGVGLSKYSKSIDAKLGERMGKLNQYYIVNPEMKEYRLIRNPIVPQISNNDNKKKICELSEKEFTPVATHIQEFIMPYKSLRYYVERYYHHPIYKYKTLGIYGDNNDLEAIIVYRKTEANGSNNIFIVDYFGMEGALRGTHRELLGIMKNEQAECISFPCEGISADELQDAGFLLRDTDNMILPVYYEPFEQRNVDLDFHFWTDINYEGIVIVKGDADQDRPNRL